MTNEGVEWVCLSFIREIFQGYLFCQFNIGWYISIKYVCVYLNTLQFIGNSDRRAAPPVKEHAKSITKRTPAMRPWKENGQRTCVSSMSDGDFFSSEQSYIMPKAGCVKITLHQDDGTIKVFREGLTLEAGEVIDASK